MYLTSVALLSWGMRTNPSRVLLSWVMVGGSSGRFKAVALLSWRMRTNPSRVLPCWAAVEIRLGVCSLGVCKR